MIIKDWKKEAREKWKPIFAIFPLKLDDGDYIWFEWVERRLAGWYGGQFGDVLQWEYRTKDGRKSSWFL